MFDMKVRLPAPDEIASAAEADWYNTGQGEVQQVGRVQGAEARGGPEEVRRGRQEARCQVQVGG